MPSISLLLALVLGPRLRRTMHTRRLGLQCLRSLLLLGATSLFFAALSFIPLADATAIMFVAPIVVTALAMPLLGERVGPHRWASVVVGFLGALVIIRPGTEAMDPAALLALGGASCYALYQIATRRLSATEAPLTTLAYTASIGVLATSALMPFLWLSARANALVCHGWARPSGRHRSFRVDQSISVRACGHGDAVRLL